MNIIILLGIQNDIVLILYRVYWILLRKNLISYQINVCMSFHCLFSLDNKNMLKCLLESTFPDSFIDSFSHEVYGINSKVMLALILWAVVCMHAPLPGQKDAQLWCAPSLQPSASLVSH